MPTPPRAFTALTTPTTLTAHSTTALSLFMGCIF